MQHSITCYYTHIRSRGGRLREAAAPQGEGQEERQQAEELRAGAGADGQRGALRRHQRPRPLLGRGARGQCSRRCIRLLRARAAGGQAAGRGRQRRAAGEGAETAARWRGLGRLPFAAAATSKPVPHGDHGGQGQEAGGAAQNADGRAAEGALPRASEPRAAAARGAGAVGEPGASQPRPESAAQARRRGEGRSVAANTDTSTSTSTSTGTVLLLLLLLMIIIMVIIMIIVTVTLLLLILIGDQSQLPPPSPVALRPPGEGAAAAATQVPPLDVLRLLSSYSCTYLGRPLPYPFGLPAF